MDNEIQLISDGDGLAVIGEEKAVERFLRDEGLWAESRALDLRGLKPLLTRNSAVIPQEIRSRPKSANVDHRAGTTFLQVKRHFGDDQHRPTPPTVFEQEVRFRRRSRGATLGLSRTAGDLTR